MHGHYLLKLTASLAQVRKTPLYSIIFVQNFCTLFNAFYIYIWPRSACCPFVLDNIELFEESLQCLKILSK